MSGAGPSNRPGTTDWRQRYRNWKDIGEQYKVVSSSRVALPPDEIKFCKDHGIVFEKQLGRGSYGAVWLVTRTRMLPKLGGQGEDLNEVVDQLACKILNLKTFSAQTFTQQSVEEAVQELLDEFQIHETLLHKNIVKCDYMTNIEDKKSGFPFARLLIFMELCEGDLNDELENSAGQKYTEREAMVMFKDVCEGLQYLHDQNICHLDIKSKNVMYVYEGNQICYKLADFGNSRRFASESTAKLSGKLGTRPYMAPELAANTGNYVEAKPTDIFALGSVLAEVMVSKQKFSECVNQFQNNQGQEDTISANFGIPVLCGQLISKMTRENPSTRPTIAEVRNDPWIANN